MNRLLRWFVSTKEQCLLLKRLSLLLRGGLSLSEALHLLEKEDKRASMKEILTQLINSVEHGQQLSDGLAKFKSVFSPFVIHVVKIGENTGSLPENLHYLATELQQRRILHRKIMTTLIYPGIVLFSTSIILGVLTLYVFPRILPIFQSFNFQLPWSTRLLLFVMGGIIHHTALIGLALLPLLAIAWIIKKSKRLKRAGHRWSLVIPVVGKLIQNYILANFCRTLGQLLQNNVPIMKALTITRLTTGNTLYKKEITALGLAINHGQTLSGFLQERPRLFPSLLSQLVAVGERTGTLGDNLHYLAGIYEQDLTDVTAQLSVLLEPVLMIIIGGLVGFIAISIITPIYQVTQQIHG